MMSKFVLSMLVAVAVCGPIQEAAAQESTLGGALFGGAAGAIVGGALGGGRGAAIGAIVGAGTGAAIGAQGEPRPRRLSLVSRAAAISSSPAAGPRFRRAIAVSRRNTRRRRPGYYDDTPRCMRSPSYDPRRGTFIGRDGYERPCP